MIDFVDFVLLFAIKQLEQFVLMDDFADLFWRLVHSIVRAGIPLCFL